MAQAEATLINARRLFILSYTTCGVKWKEKKKEKKTNTHIHTMCSYTALFPFFSIADVTPKYNCT